MANITPVQPIDLQSEIADWQSAVYGEEVRGASVSALQKIQGTVNDTVTNVNQAAEDAAQAVADISGAITQTQENAQAAAGSAEAAAGSASAAETSKGEAATSASNAAASAEAAAESAEKAAQVEGFDGTAATVKATDTYGLVASALGESNVQALIDAIADRVINQLVNKSQIINNLLATQPGNVLDAVQGAALKEIVDQNTDDIAQLNGNFYKKVSGVDIETLEPGDYYCSSSCTNLPERAYCVVSVITWASGEKAVVALSVTTHIMYSRFFVNGGWRDWHQSNGNQLFKIATITGETTTIQPNTSAGISIPTNNPVGFKPLFASIGDTSVKGVFPRSCMITTETQVTVYLDNTTSLAVEVSLRINVLYIKI